MNNKLHTKEKAFHDGWANSVDLETIKINEFFESPVAVENNFIMNQIGSLKGKKILDVGCGLGESAVYFALKGAIVTASDLSPKMIECATRLADKYDVKIKTKIASAEELSGEIEKYDIIYVANLLHHIVEKEDFIKNMNKILKKGGYFCSWDPVKYNPVINIYRKIATKVRTEDERPLGFKEINLIQKSFSKSQISFFWFSTLLLFLKYAIIDRKNPNEYRYWKEIYRETDTSLTWLKPFRFMDNFFCKLPLLKWLSWNVAIVAQKN